MTCKGSTGQGVTLSLSVDTTIARLRSVQLPEWIIEMADFTGLDSDAWRCRIPAGPADPGAFNAEMFFDSGIVMPTLGIIQVATFTFPLQDSGNSTKATLTGSGSVIQTGWGNAAIGDPLVSPLVFAFDGNSTPPAFTLEAA